MKYASSEHEPLLDELFADPIIQLLMQKDGVQEQDLWPLIDRVAQHMHSKMLPLN
jgi:hypothetical protein